MNEKIQYVTRASRRHSNGTFKPTTYTIHNTGNMKASAQNERDNLQNNAGTTSFHSVVDEKQVIRCIPFNCGAWHAGDGENGAGNKTSLSLEICEGSLHKNFEQTWKNAVEVVAHDLLYLGWGVDRLRQHYYWSGKNCPRYIREKGLWEKFKNDVKKEMEAKKKNETKFPDAQKWVKEMGISDGSNPKEPITREQVWEMLYRMKKKGVI